MSDQDKEYHKAYRKEYAKKVRYVNVAVPLSSYNELEKLAKKEDTKVTTLLRNMSLAYMQQKVFVPKEIEEELKELRFLIRNIANNVNQIAHHSNLVEKLVNENEFLMEIKKLEDAVFDYTKKRLDTN
jgi:hypothetical protein